MELCTGTDAESQYRTIDLVLSDANGTVTQITYGDVAGPNGNVTGLYPTKTEVAANYSTLKRTSEATFDFYTGAVLTTTDVDNGVTNATEYDALGRPTKAISALGVTGLEAWTQTEYDDINRRVVVRSDLETKGDGKKVAVQFFDQLGRVRLSKTLEDATNQSATNETDGIKVQTRYKTVSGYTYQLSSNPYRANFPANETDPTMGWTLSTAWSTGRRSEVQTFSGGALPVAFGGSNQNSTGIIRTDIDANTTLVTDQAGKQRRSVTNALGQLIRVDEPDANGNLGSVASPTQPTFYSFDALNNLTVVTQGIQTRTFLYSSLSRMISETSPEAGTTTYEFDNGGNPTRKTDSRGVSTNFSYDALGRVTQKTYMGESGYTTPTITYIYDEWDHSKGKLTKISSSISETRFLSFDVAGRVTSSRQTTDGEDYDLQYSYNLAGMLVEQTYPSGRKVRNVFEGDSNLSMVQSRKSENQGYFNYAKNFAYNPTGAVTSMQLGNGNWQETAFNSRLQATQIAQGTTNGATNVLKLDLDYGSTQNNGNLISQTITIPGLAQPFIQTYTYDTLNRLTSATETNNSNQTWKQTFTFDRFGNRNFDEVNTTTLPKECNGNTEMCSVDRKLFNPSISPTTNRLNTSEDHGFDNAGNTTGDAHGRTFKYDGENKQYEVRDSGSQVIGQYYFDGAGKRVKKVVPSSGEVTVFVYDVGGNLSVEYSTNLSETQQVTYVTSDQLGSPRIKTDQNGAVVARNDYHPYGEEVSTSQRTQGLGYKSDDLRQRFTSYQRDEEIDLDFAEARMYSNRNGRFTTCDPIRNSKDHPANPQRWNLYIYVINNPLRLVDIDGEKPRTVNIFLGIKVKPGHLTPEGMKEWRELAKRPPKGVKVNIYTMDEGTATAKEFIKSISTENTTTIYFGHAYGDDTMGRGKGGVGLEFYDSQVAQADQVGKNEGKTVGLANVDAKGDSIGVFACDSGKTFDNLGSSKGTALVSMQNGPDLGTGIDALQQTALEFTRTAIRGSTPQASRDSAQAVFFANSHTGDGNKDNPGVTIRRLEQ